jgi:hypothetical protein
VNPIKRTLDEAITHDDGRRVTTARKVLGDFVDVLWVAAQFSRFFYSVFAERHDEIKQSESKLQ